jgi:transposase InsO family protein
MEVITLSRKEISRYQVIKDSLDRKLSNNKAATLLGLSKRQIMRLKNKVRRDNLMGIVHGNCGRTPKIAIAKETKEIIINLYLNTYNGFNVSHFGEFLKEAHGINISRETIRNLLLTSGLRSKAKSAPKHRSRRARMPKEGLLIQMDSSEHQWLGQSSIWLIATIDDATGEVPCALFVHTDSTENNMRVIKKLVEVKGIPMALYTDGASHFVTQRHYSYRVNLRYDYAPTQIQRALNELGVRLIIAGSPQAKGRIERLFKTFQDRLLKELKLHKISSIEEANRYLHNVFIPKFNKRFYREPKDPEVAWRVIPREINLESVFSIKEQRTVMADNTISWRSRIFQILPDKHRISFAKAKVVVEKRLDDSIHIRYKDQYLQFKELSTYQPKKNKTNHLALENLLTGDIFTLHQG